MSQLEEAIQKQGKEIFNKIGESQPSGFNTAYWAGKIMEWSMKAPAFKTDMFRLVDVLPALKGSYAIASHVQEYLSDSAKEISGLISWGVNIPPKSLRAKAASIAVRQGVTQMARQFIAGETPSKSLKELRRLRRSGLAFTVDLLGEYCVSEKEALAYYDRYQEALDVFGEQIPRWDSAASLFPNHPGEHTPVCISVKLSALYSQCYPLNYDKSIEVLTERLTQLARVAKARSAQIYIDAEDSGRNPVVYQVFKNVFGSEEFKDFPYPGIVLQAYAKNSLELTQDLLSFAKQRGAPIAIRLVKGAYWDAETVSASQHDWENPLFLEKWQSDKSFEDLSRLLLDNTEYVLPAFGSHNIRSLVHACCYADSIGVDKSKYELQMLYGMAEPIAKAFQGEGYLVRLYVPLGELIPGMGYLVRRLLENTSNESFLRHTFYDDTETSELLQAPGAQSSNNNSSNDSCDQG